MKFINTINSVFNKTHAEKFSISEKAQSDGGIIKTVAPTNEIIGVEILGQGSDTPELHVRFNGRLSIFPLTNPVTAKQIADIIASVG